MFSFPLRPLTTSCLALQREEGAELFPPKDKDQQMPGGSNPVTFQQARCDNERTFSFFPNMRRVNNFDTDLKDTTGMGVGFGVGLR